MKAPLSKWVCVLWRYDWKPSYKGTYTIKVRGIDTSGRIQESASFFGRFFRTFPDGAKGLHSVDVTVT